MRVCTGLQAHILKDTDDCRCKRQVPYPSIGCKILFLNCVFQEEIYMAQPPYSNVEDDRVIRLRRVRGPATI